MVLTEILEVAGRAEKGLIKLLVELMAEL